MSFDLQPTLFTPRQAEQITGIRMARQRDLRRHGYLPQHEGHAKFSAVDLAEMLVLAAMMRRGIGPSDAIQIAKISAVGIVLHALADPAAFEGMDKADWTVPGEQPSTAKAEWLARDFANAQARKGDHRWRVLPGNFLIIFADGSEIWHHSVDEAFRKFPPTDRRRTGAITVIDLAAMGKQMLRKSQLPLVTVIAREN